ncbi:hypothetical protein PCANC_28850, partial [Puccinia coronata f. sp. avenae]
PGPLLRSPSCSTLWALFPALCPWEHNSQALLTSYCFRISSGTTQFPTSFINSDKNLISLFVVDLEITRCQSSRALFLLFESY